MKKYYVLDKDSQVAKDYFAWKEEQFKINKAFGELAQEQGIDTHKYYAVCDHLWICPTNKDNEKFKNELKKTEYGVFKKSSPTSKAWVEKCNDKGIQGLTKPYLMFYFTVSGRCRESLFDVNGTVYATYESETDFECEISSFKEIKGSEYYKIIEDAGIKS